MPKSSRLPTAPPWLPRLAKCLLPLAYAAAFALFTWWLDRRMTGVATGAYFGWVVLANALPGLLAAGLLMALTRRPGFSFLAVTLLQALVYYASSIKLSVLGDPLGMQDLYFVTSPDPASVELLGSYVPHPALLAVATALLVAALVFAWRREKPAFRNLRATQLLLASASLLLVHSLAVAGRPWSDIYSKETLRPSRFDSMMGVLHGGLMSNLVYAHNTNLHTFRAVDTTALKRMQAILPPQPVPTVVDTTRPDIVVILSESMFDPRIMNGMRDLPDTIPNVRAAIERGHGGYMKVPTFGGGTIRTEFEVVTGMPMSAFPNAEFPYVSLVRDRIPSLVSQVERHGYRTIAIHGNAGSFWNRTNAYKAIGFDKFLTKAQFPADARYSGRYLTDAAMTDMIERQLDTAGPPTLVLALSIEAHGPYKMAEIQDRAGRDAVPVPAKLPPDQALELRNYLYHIHHADQQFGRLLRYLRDRKRPTVVLIFGDHLPGLRDVFATLGFLDSREGETQYVPWAMLRTDMPAQGPSGHKESWMLPGELLHLAGLDDDPYFTLTRSVSQGLAHASRADDARLRAGLDAAAVARLNGDLARYLATPATAGRQ